MVSLFAFIISIIKNNMNIEAYTSASISSPKQNPYNIAQQTTQLDEYIQDNVLELVFAFEAEDETILDVFQQSAQQLHFKLIQREESHCIIIKNKPKQRFSICNCCKWFFDNTPITAIKMTINKNIHTSKKICKIRGLVGFVNQVQQFFDNFENKTKQSKKSIIVIQQTQQNHHEQFSNPFQLQASTMYYVCKQLSNLQSPLGQKVAKQFIDFRQSFKNVQQSADLVPAPLKSILSLINQVNAEMYVMLSQSKTTKQFSNYLKISIEKYIFDKVQPILRPIYNFKNNKTQQIFTQKVDQIFEKLKSKQILQELSLDKKFWFLPQQMLDQPITQNKLKNIMGYDEACNSLAKIKITNSPRQKIKFVDESYSRIKMTFFQKSGRQEQLLIMQDIIPATILLILVCKIDELRTELDLMKDFLDCQNNMDLQSQKRIVINLSESFFYIVRDWKI